LLGIKKEEKDSKEAIESIGPEEQEKRIRENKRTLDGGGKERNCEVYAL